MVVALLDGAGLRGFKGFNLNNYLYGVFAFCGFFEDVAYGLIETIVSVGSNQIFFTVDLSNRGDEENIFSISFHYFSTIEGSEIDVVDCRDAIVRSDDVNELLGREGDIEEELSCLVVDLDYEIV